MTNKNSDEIDGTSITMDQLLKVQTRVGCHESEFIGLYSQDGLSRMSP